MAGNKSKKPVYFWDSGIIIQWLKTEPEDGRTELDLTILQDMILLAEASKITLLVSALWRMEVLPAKFSDIKYTKITEAFSGQNLLEVAITNKVLILAQELRNQAIINNNGNSGKIIKTPDAIILASAIIHNVDIFYTYDKTLLDYDNTQHNNGFILNVKQPTKIDGLLL